VRGVTIPAVAFAVSVVDDDGIEEKDFDVGKVVVDFDFVNFFAATDEKDDKGETTDVEEEDDEEVAVPSFIHSHNN
jgi:hypothetical protein